MVKLILPYFREILSGQLMFLQKLKLCEIAILVMHKLNVATETIPLLIYN